jgi:hypothetical protein
MINKVCKLRVFVKLIFFGFMMLHIVHLEMKNDKLIFIKNVNNFIIANPDLYFNLCTFASNQINKQILL